MRWLPWSAARARPCWPRWWRATTTTRLVARHHLAAGAASEHLSVLRATGLVTAQRAGREVRYTLTPIGHALLSGPS